MNHRRPVPKLVYVLLAIAVYTGLACIVFQWRHPWMTETELFLHIPDAWVWGSVEYQEVRPR